jgi:hypothetical protein
VKGRALEGLGFAYEQKGNLDEALKTFKELENTVDVRGFKELAMYHQARVLQAKGENGPAKDLLMSLTERLKKPGEPHAFPYLQEVAQDRLHSLDPTAGAAGAKPSEEQIRQLMQQMQLQQHPE